MNITRTELGNLNARIDLTVTNEDYKERLDKRLKEARRSFNVPGFRPGQVPMGIITKRFGKGLLVEEVLNAVQDNLYNYLKESNIRIFGEPVEISEVNNTVNFEGEAPFLFAFEIGLQPEITIDLAKQTIPYYDIIIDDKTIDLQIEDMRKRNSTPNSVSEMVNENCLIKADLAELDAEGNIPADAQIYSSIVVSIKDVADEDTKTLLLAAKVDQSFNVNPLKVFKKESLQYMLRVPANSDKPADTDHRITITEITDMVPSELNEEFFDKIFPDDEVKDEKTFREKVGEWIGKYLKEESDAKLFFDGRNHLIENVNFELPHDFLKRLLLRNNTSENATKEKLEEEYPLIEKDFRWQIIKDKILSDADFRVTDEQIAEYAQNSVREYLSRVGYHFATEEQVADFAKSLIKKDEERNRIIDKITNDRVTMEIKNTANLERKEILRDDYNKMVEEDHSKN